MSTRPATKIAIRVITDDHAPYAGPSGHAWWLLVAGVWANAGRRLRMAAAAGCALLLLGARPRFSI
jgi:hypothetical protein